MDTLERLAAIEDIKQVKAAYFLGFDTKDWDMWREKVWAPDARLEVPELDMVVEPRETMIEWVRQQSVGQVSAHHGHTPLIEFVSDTEAKVIWAMEDELWGTAQQPLPGGFVHIHGWGHYHETYVKIDVGWRLKTTRLTRIRVEMTGLR